MKESCSKKSCLISFVAVFIFLNLYSMLVHHNLLMEDYAATSHLWRTAEEMESLNSWWILYYALIAMIFTCWFKKTRACFVPSSCSTDGKTCCPIKSGGLCFGMKLGIFMGLMMGSAYLYMPIPMDLAVKWFFTGLFEGIGVGVILGMTYRGDNSCTIPKNDKA